MEHVKCAVRHTGRYRSLLPSGARCMQTLARGLLACVMLAAMTGGAAYAGGGEDGTGGGDGGGGTGTPPGTTQCFISFGAGSDYFVGVNSSTLSATLNWTIPPGTFTYRQRFVATGADGSITEDTGWEDGGPDMPVGPASGSDSVSIPDVNNSIDISGGTVFEVQFTDPNTGQTVDAEGETYPPDPVTGGC